MFVSTKWWFLNRKQKYQTLLGCPPEKWQRKKIYHSISSTKWSNGSIFSRELRESFPNSFPCAANLFTGRETRLARQNPPHQASPSPLQHLKYVPRPTKSVTPFQILSQNSHFPMYPNPLWTHLCFPHSWKKPTVEGGTPVALFIRFPSLWDQKLNYLFPLYLLMISNSVYRPQ